ncbi:BTB/POZ domain-containing protein 6-B-like isoform X1 [Penaeus chinensis]|uniref:BTB/POZ domain-containing protein 6-B-like isoform X1 n=1 Tax=Penaeus chinensis TaxID=139456 RepID=UPI001FB80A67|nr:BTB/POZ domain-containing protein 6-B-like isoform X1 [Penaeus chinensis]
MSQETMSMSMSQEESWQSQLVSPEQRLSALLKSSRLADLTINFPGHERCLQAHRLVLAMTSPVFEAMLYGPLAEGEELNLHEDPPEAFEWLLEYMYRGHIQMPEVRLAVQVYQLASKYQVEALMVLCSKYLQETLRPENLAEMYDTAVLLEDEHLLQRCYEVVDLYPTAVLSSPSFGLLSRGALRHLLQRPLHIPTEVILLKALLACSSGAAPSVCQIAKHYRRVLQEQHATRSTLWFYASCMIDTDFPRLFCSLKWGQARRSTKGLRDEISDFLPMVRFLSMTTDEFVEHVMPSGVLSLQEISSILMNIKELMDVPLPTICCPTRDKRLCYVDSLLRRLTLSTTPALARSRKSARGSIFVHNSQEQILIMNLRTSNTLLVSKLECKGIHPTAGSAAVAIKDHNGCVIGSATSEGPVVEFEEHVSLQPDVSHCVTVRLEGHWPRGEMGDFVATTEGVEIEGKIAYTEGRIGSVTLHFWCFN